MPIPFSVEEVVLWLCNYPSCEEVIVVGLALCLVPLSEEVIVVWLSALSLLCEVIVVVSSLLSKGCFVGEWSCILQVCNCKFLDGGSLCGRSCVGIYWKSFYVKVGMQSSGSNLETYLGICI